MKRGGEYKKSLPESLKSKLFIPRSAEGWPNHEIFEVARAMDALFSKYPWYAGITLRGSQVTGYRTLSSDADVTLFFDSSFFSKEEDIFDDCEEIEKAIEHAHGIKIQLFTRDVQELGDLYKRTKAFKGVVGRSAFAAISRIGVGPHLKKWRETARLELAGMSEDQREFVIEQTAHELATQDVATVRTKVDPRIAEADPVRAAKIDISSTFDARYRLWEKRIRTLYSV